MARRHRSSPDHVMSNNPEETGTSTASATTPSVMSEDAWFELVSASVDGELSAAESELVEQHLERSPQARDRQQQLIAMRRQTLLHSVAPIPDLTDEIVARSRADETPTIARHRHRGRRRSFIVAGISSAAAALVAAVLLAAVQPWSSPSPESSNETATITASDSAFDHTDVHVTAGSAITWHNVGDITHELVQQLPNASITGLLRPNEDRSVTIDEPGVYEFYCDIHPNMTGTITVDG